MDTAKQASHPAQENLHSVTVYFNCSAEEQDSSMQLGQALEAALQDSGPGYLAGHELNESQGCGRYFLFGPNAEQLFKAVEHLLSGQVFMDNAVAVLRFGPMDSDAPEIDIDIRYRPRPENTICTIILDGLRIQAMDDLWREWVQQIDAESAQYFGRNPVAFQDAIAGGGPGHPGECRVVFRNQVALKRAIGVESMAWRIGLFSQANGIESVFES